MSGLDDPKHIAWLAQQARMAEELATELNVEIGEAMRILLIAQRVTAKHAIEEKDRALLRMPTGRTI